MGTTTSNNPTTLITGRPVPSLPIEFQWHGGVWKELFDKHVQFIQQDILRALADNKLAVYLSCPISSRAGSYFATNVEIANFTAQRLVSEWGPRFWFLNPAQYQMESSQGLGLIRMHAYQLGLEKGTTIDVDQLMKTEPTVGGDYMRMWTRVLAEDGARDWGDRFGAFCFLSPSDVKAFFARTGAKDITAGVESYFADKFTADPSFHEFYSLPFKDEHGKASTEPAAVQAKKLEQRKQDFFRFYTIRASAYYSKGSHDEWNIWQLLNELRVRGDERDHFGMGSQIAGYFEGHQVEPGAAESLISAGYAVTQSTPGSPAPAGSPKPTVVAQTAFSTSAIERLARHMTRKQEGQLTIVTDGPEAEAIKQMYDEALVAFRKGDLEAVLGHWEDDGAYLWPAVPPSIGKAAIRASYEAFFAQWTAEEIFHRYEIEISGDLAYSRFGTNLTLTPKNGGEPNHMTLEGIHVLHKRPSGWKFKVVIAINVPPPVA